MYKECALALGATQLIPAIFHCPNGEGYPVMAIGVYTQGAFEMKVGQFQKKADHISIQQGAAQMSPDPN